MRPLKGILSLPTTHLLLIPLVATVLVSLTSLVLVYHPDFTDVWQYGLPLAWRTQINPSCGGPGGPLDLLRGCAVSTIYQWDVFALDFALFVGLGYLFFLLGGKHWSLFMSTIILVSAAWLTCATAYLVSAPPPPPAYLAPWPTPPPAWTNGFPLHFMRVDYYGQVFNWIWFAIDMALFAALEALALFLYRGLRLSRVPDIP